MFNPTRLSFQKIASGLKISPLFPPLLPRAGEGAGG